MCCEPSSNDKTRDSDRWLAAWGRADVGETNAGVVVLSTATSLITAKKLKVLGIASLERQPIYKDYPTISEQGFPRFQVDIWSGLFVLEKTPGHIVEKLESGVKSALSDQSVLGKLKAIGATPGALTRDQFINKIKSEIESSKNLVAAMNAKSK